MSTEPTPASVVKPGWRTSELTLSGASGYGIFELASQPVETLQQAIVTAAGCLALAAVAIVYALQRSAVKGAAVEE
jgi:hypothetical protein